MNHEIFLNTNQQSSIIFIQTSEIFFSSYIIESNALLTLQFESCKGTLRLKNYVALKCAEYPLEYYKYVLRSI